MSRSDLSAAARSPEPTAAPRPGADCPSAAPLALGVARSLTGRSWTLAPGDERLTAALVQRLGLPEIVARVMALRGIGLEAAASFLDPRLRDLLPDPCRLKDMRKAAERVAAAVVNGQRIAVFGDYDVDGATAAALLLRFLRAVGCEPLLYVPDRLREGYGPNAPALRGLRDRGVGLVVTVDCGIAAHEALADASSAGLDVVVVDHHQASLPLPPAIAIVNPKRPDDQSGLDHLCAAGLAFLLMVDTNRLLRTMGHYTVRPEPDLRQWLDLVALGTVCDVVPLAGVNRAFVTQGLKVMAQRRNAGLCALADLAGLRAPPSARDLGFAIGPRINAGGRVGQADLGARLLACDDPVEAGKLGGRLNALNGERQQIEQAVWTEAAARIGDGAEAPLLWACGRGWHPGVIGIIASRLAERYRRPTLVMAIDGDRAMASGRSVPGRDLGAAVNAAVAAGLLLKGGGHAMAAGFTAETGRLGELRAFLEARLAIDAATAEGLRALSVDAVLSLAGAAALPPSVLARLAPFGPSHPEPRFVLEAVRIAHTRPAGGAHLVCGLIDGLGAKLPAIAFRCIDQPLGQALAAHAGAPFHLAGRLQARHGGGTLQLIIDDAAPALGG